MTYMSPQNLIQQAMVHFRAGRLSQVQAIAQRILSENKRNADALALLGHVAQERADYEEAERWYRKAINSDRKQPLYHCHLGRVLTTHGRLTEAMASFEKALKLQPGNLDAIAGKTDVLEKRGKFDRAWKLIEPIVASGDIKPSIAVLCSRLLVRRRKHEQAVEFARQQLERADLPDTSRRTLLFILGQALNRLDDCDAAFEAYHQGNRIRSVVFDSESVRQRFETMMRIFSREAMPDLPRAQCRSELPVFIVGMPRCGSTLIEQIIHAHPQGCGAGELPIFGDMILDMHNTVSPDHPYPQCLAELTQQKLDRLAEIYLNRLMPLGRRADRVVDKTLDSFERIGLITLMLPEARIIHARRHPMDQCLSCFIRDLPPRLHPYSTDLRDLGLYHRLYDQLMAHWRSIGGLRMLDVDYEELVADQETVSRRIIEFIGLDWDDRCLLFHEARRDVATASYDQVRQPIYTSAVARYERYEKHLGPLKEALGDIAQNQAMP